MKKEFEEWVDNHVGNQDSKTAIVTGANTGIGFYTALGLAKKGANVILAGRSEEKLQHAISSILEDLPAARVSMAIVDLASLQSVRDFAGQFLKDNRQLDLLVLNAGVMMPPAATTEEGFELQFGVNYLAHFLLTQLLLPVMRSTPNARVVTVSSIAHRAGVIDFDNLRLEKPFDTRKLYYQSKLANIIFALELARREVGQEQPVMSVACHPGITASDLQRHLDPEIIRKMNFMETWQGSLPTLLAATKTDVQPGDYYGPDGEGEFMGWPAPGVIEERALDTELGKLLWEKSMVYSGLQGNVQY